MKIAFYGSSLLSSYWNGAATYYRGLLKALAARGYDITFYEPDVYDRQQNRDIEAPDWCSVVVYEATPQALLQVAARAAEADIVVKGTEGRPGSMPSRGKCWRHAPPVFPWKASAFTPSSTMSAGKTSGSAPAGFWEDRWRTADALSTGRWPTLFHGQERLWRGRPEQHP